MVHTNGDHAPVSEDAAGSAPRERGGSPLLIGVGALLIYMAFVGVMLFLARSQNETIWSRSLYLFSGVETIAFAAAGFVFGREVNRARAETAERRADQESKAATEAKTEGRQLARELKDLAAEEEVEVTDRLQPQAAMGVDIPAADAWRSGNARTAKLRSLADRAERAFG